MYFLNSTILEIFNFSEDDKGRIADTDQPCLIARPQLGISLPCQATTLFCQASPPNCF